MRLDHIVLHTNNEPAYLQSLSKTLTEQGYPFDPTQGSHSNAVQITPINIGDEYLEVVRLPKTNTRTWIPRWSRQYEQGERGAYCLFFEVEDAERTAVALKHADIDMQGPAVITYPSLLGLIHSEAPYFIYYFPSFPGSILQMALMQYKKANGRAKQRRLMQPNSNENGIAGIRQVTVELPDLNGSLAMLKKAFPELEQNSNAWQVQVEKVRLRFCASEDPHTHVKVNAVTSLRARLGQKFNIDNVEVITTGG